MTTILVTGATGRVGRHVVRGLLEAGVGVRALVRTPALAGLPAEVEVVPGDIYNPAAVSRAAAEVDAAFLLWPAFTADGAAPVLTALTKQVRRVVYLSSMSVSEADPSASGVWGELEVLLTDAGADWTFVRPGGFAASTLEWAEQIRTGNVVRMPFPNAGRSLIHERDIADVAVQALLHDKHIGQTYALTGPEVLTQAQQVATIATVLNRQLRVEETPPPEARRSMLTQGLDPSFIDSALTYWHSLVANPEPVTTTVETLLTRPALTYHQWAEDHADDFRD
ncbi:SDR family oxidoreductase [Kribbella sp. NPDC051620]|uniref:SDR family oxidoreductase n=1 Tax=Kribbella sp. NPDC051620 TaxID=3364120 RepID=UPI0037AAB342